MAQKRSKEYAEYHKRYLRMDYIKNKGRYLLYAKKRRDKIKNFVREYKNTHPCTECGIFYPYYVMEFDHLRDKEYEIARMVNHTQSIERIKSEMAKCELVCANCHKERTYNRVSRTGVEPVSAP